MSSILEILNENTPSVIKNYIRLQGKINIDEIKALKSIFDNLDKFEIREISLSADGTICDGLMMIPNHKKEINVMTFEEKEKLIKNLMSNINNIEDGYYNKTLISLIEKINYIDASEQTILNYLFLEIKLENKKIEEYGKVQNKYMIR